MIELTEAKRQNLKEEMVKTIRKNKYYGYVDDEALNKLLDLWCEKKEKIYNCFKEQSTWNEKELCLVVPTKVYRQGETRKALNVLNEILSVFKRNARRGNFYRETYANMFYYFILSDATLTRKPDYNKAWFSDLRESDKHYYLQGEGSKEKLYSLLYYTCRFSVGMKVSRVLCKILEYMGEYFNIDYQNLTYILEEQTKNRTEDGFEYTHTHNWEQTKAKLTDYVSPLELDETFYISINPLDYLTMSHGKGWSSCHSLRQHGCYHSATITSLVDSSTIIIYTLPSEHRKSKFWGIDKQTRQMAFLSEDLDGIFQQVFYPDRSCNDGEVTKNILQEILANYHKVENKWNSDRDNCSMDSCKFLGYKDWECGKRADYSILEGHKPVFKIGGEAPCIDKHTEILKARERITYYRGKWITCQCCNELVNEDDMIKVGSTRICKHCFEKEYTYCKSCNKIEKISDTINIDGQTYCTSCAKEIKYVTTEEGFNTLVPFTLTIDDKVLYYKDLNNLQSAYPEAVQCNDCGSWYIGECKTCIDDKDYYKNLKFVINKIRELNSEDEYFDFKEEFIKLLSSPTDEVKEIIKKMVI